MLLERLWPQLSKVSAHEQLAKQLVGDRLVGMWVRHAAV